MSYRTKTYIAADWDGDKDAVDQLYKWNNSNYWGLSFHDAHELHQSRDTSLKCNIKRSLAERLDASKTFVLIVGEHTASLTNGSCQHCNSYNSRSHSCARNYSVDTRSYIEFECEKAIRDGLKIVVLYNSTIIDKSKCPACIRYTGIHKPMRNILGWDYQTVKEALN